MTDLPASKVSDKPSLLTAKMLLTFLAAFLDLYLRLAGLDVVIAAIYLFGLTLWHAVSATFALCCSLGLL